MTYTTIIQVDIIYAKTSKLLEPERKMLYFNLKLETRVTFLGNGP